MITNKGFYKRYKNFGGSLIDWFNTCVDEDDIFRFWYKDGVEDADFVKIVNVIDIGNDYLLGLKIVDWNNVDEEEQKASVFYKRLSEVSSFMIIANEEDYD